MNPMNNIELVKALHQIWNTGDLALIDSVYADDFLAHWPSSSEVPERRGIEGIRFGVERIRTAFPDWHEQVMDVFGSGDRIASRYVSTGTHKGTSGASSRPGAVSRYRRFRFSESPRAALSSNGAWLTIWQGCSNWVSASNICASY
jgi:ketosteroid isomerase-like protein